MSLTQTERECIGVERIHQYLKNTTENIINDTPHSTKKTIEQKPEIIDCLKEPEFQVEFKNVSLRYNLESGNYALKDISFQIKKNQKVAFVGRTGCGKTTILNALFKLYPIESSDLVYIKEFEFFYSMKAF